MNLETKIIKKTYSLARKYVMRILTNKLGKVVEEDDKIICYVKKRKSLLKNNDYFICCFGINRNIELAQAYELDKPIYYVIDNLKFSKYVHIFGYDGCNVAIKNCEFNLGCYISINGTCVLEKSYIHDYNYLKIDASNLKLINMKLNEIPYSNSSFTLGLNASEKLDIVNTQIGKVNKKMEIFLNAQEVSIINSEIEGREINLDVPIVKMNDKSSFVASDLVNIKASDFEKINIKAPKVIYNGIDASSTKKEVTLEKITDPLKLKRMELVNVLKQLKNKCDEEKLNQLNNCEESLNKKPVMRLLRK